MTTSARPQPLTAAAPKITMKHAGWVSSNSFDAIGVTYDEQPDLVHKYLASEGTAGAISAAMIEAFGLLFQLTPAPVGGAHTVDAVDGFVYTIKPSMVATPAVTDLKLGGLAVGHEYHFAGGDAAAADWRKALTLLLKRGFKGVRKLSTDVVTKSLQTAMLEADFVEYMEILKPGESKPQVRIFWRCDSRGKDKFIDIDAAVARVDTKAEATNCNLTESWHPYSDPDINKMLWLRLNQKDNDYYTIVSVGTELRDCTAFPTLDENKAYTFPAGVDAQHIKPLKNWTLAELQTQAKVFRQGVDHDGDGYVEPHRRVHEGVRLHGRVQQRRRDQDERVGRQRRRVLSGARNPWLRQELGCRDAADAARASRTGTIGWFHAVQCADGTSRSAHRRRGVEAPLR